MDDDVLEMARDYAASGSATEDGLREVLRDTADRAIAFRLAWNLQGFEIIRLQDELEAERVKNGV